MTQKHFTQPQVETALADILDLLTVDQRSQLLKVSTLENYKKGEDIYVEGQAPIYMMCLLKGKVKVFRNGVGGRSQIIRMIKPVEYFGYRAGFVQSPYITGAAAFEASVVCLIPINLIYKLMSENIKLALYFIHQLCLDLGTADERTVNLTQKHIRGRLAEALLVLKESYGLEEDQSTLSIYLSREDLANLSNMTTSNAIRTLSIFAAEGVISIDGRKIKLLDEEQLLKISING